VVAHFHDKLLCYNILQRLPRFGKNVADAAEYYNKSCVFFIYNNGKELKNKKINVIDY